MRCAWVAAVALLACSCGGGAGGDGTAMAGGATAAPAPERTVVRPDDVATPARAAAMPDGGATTTPADAARRVTGVCSPLQPASCKPGEGCYPVDQGGTTCAVAGTAKEDEPCMVMGDCQPGMLCVVYSLKAVCRPACDAQTPACPAGQRCAPLATLPAIGSCVPQ